jgi:NAD+ synthase (glutamine-hydrolysing)
MRIALAQINPTIGDFEGNSAKILEYAARARAAGAALVVFPELTISGYPPQDLLDRPCFADGARRTLDALAPKIEGIAALVGFVQRNPAPKGRALFNAAALIEGGRIRSVHTKALLPTYDVFDEARYFEPATAVETARLGETVLGVSICEDIWHEAFGPRPLYTWDPIEALAQKGASVILNLSASPWTVGKDRLRLERVCAHARRFRVPCLLCNQVGGNDELVFDGNSCAADAEGKLIAKGRAFAEDLVLVDLDAGRGEIRDAEREEIEDVRRAVVLGTRDYARKCGFSKAVVGLSGGIDSAVVAAVAAEAFGRENVLGVTMPSRFNLAETQSDAERVAKALGIGFLRAPIEPVVEAYLKVFAEMFPGKARDVTEENIQARIRGNLLMAVSNKLGHLVLSTGNKSELATGYCTLYGDMCGGLAVISDLPKAMVYRLAEHFNRNGEVIPKTTIARPPTAELRPDQKDADNLPEYAVLDPILEAYIERLQSPAEIVKGGADPAAVARAVRLVDGNEYKRRQAAPGLKITSKAFGFGRRMPMAQRYRPPM